MNTSSTTAMRPVCASHHQSTTAHVSIIVPLSSWKRGNKEHNTNFWNGPHCRSLWLGFWKSSEHNDPCYLCFKSFGSFCKDDLTWNRHLTDCVKKIFYKTCMATPRLCVRGCLLPGVVGLQQYTSDTPQRGGAFSTRDRLKMKRLFFKVCRVYITLLLCHCC